MAPVLITGVAEHILDVPSSYPGPHNFTQERTDPDLLPLDPRSQLLLVWDCMCDWIKEQLQQGNGVTAKGFGSFTFERAVHQLPPSIPELNHVGKEAETVEPRFVMAAELAAEVHRQPTTNMLEKNHNKGSIFQTKNMKFLNPVPIGAACYLETAVVASALRAFFSAIPQLIGNNYDLALDFKFCRVRIANKKMSCSFTASLKQMAQAALNSKRENGPIPVKNNWSRCTKDSAMASFLRHQKEEEGLLPASTTLPVSQRIEQMKLQQVDNLSVVTSATVSKGHI